MCYLPPRFRDFLLKLSTHLGSYTLNVQTSYRTFSFSVFLWWLLLGRLMFPCHVQCANFTVGVLGPWDCDPLFAKAFPELAAKLAVDRINSDPSLELGFRLTYTILQENCETSKALAGFAGHEAMSSAFVGPLNPGYCDAATLLGKNWNKAVFSWTCINYELDNRDSFPTFARTLPTPTKILFSFMKYFRWAHIGIISSNEDIWVDTASRLASSIRNEGLLVGIVTTMGNGDEGIKSALKNIKDTNNLRGISTVQGRRFLITTNTEQRSQT